MGERNGVVDRRVEENAGLDVGRWLMDTLRMWPILLLLGTVAWRSENTRSDVDEIHEDFISQGPRVSTEKSRPTTIESELRAFRLYLNEDYMPREVLDLKLNQILKEQAEVKEMLKGWMRREGES